MSVPPEFKAELALYESSLKRVDEELKRISQSIPPLLQSNGLPSEATVKAIDSEVRSLIGKYLDAPTLLEGSLLPQLGQNSIQGASFSLMRLFGVTILGPLGNVFPVMRPILAPLVMHVLSSIQEGPRDLNLLFEDLNSRIDLRAKEEKTGAEILGAKNSLRVEDQIKSALGMFLMMASSQGYVEISEDGQVLTTPRGSRLSAHLTATADWLDRVPANHEASSLVLP